MVNYRGAQFDALFLALADPTRRGMVERLCRGPATVGELGRPYAMTKPAVTKHVRTLERAGLIRREREGRVHRCVLVPETMRRAEDWIEQHRRFWEASFDRLARHLETSTPTGPGEDE
ncbi:MAG TPA: metalloregulator ArsR/SmtB family transcription factor [Gemmatimonadota bacterium]|nr:metalloregulator ArsR/SmtB family transcription factor [Gemmatimonadota bacterium]